MSMLDGTHFLSIEVPVMHMTRVCFLNWKDLTVITFFQDFALEMRSTFFKVLLSRDKNRLFIEKTEIKGIKIKKFKIGEVLARIMPMFHLKIS